MGDVLRRELLTVEEYYVGDGVMHHDAFDACSSHLPPCVCLLHFVKALFAGRSWGRREGTVRRHGFIPWLSEAIVLIHACYVTPQACKGRLTHALTPKYTVAHHRIAVLMVEKFKKDDDHNEKEIAGEATDIPVVVIGAVLLWCASTCRF